MTQPHCVPRKLLRRAAAARTSGREVGFCPGVGSGRSDPGANASWTYYALLVEVNSRGVPLIRIIGRYSGFAEQPFAPALAVTRYAAVPVLPPSPRNRASAGS